jgi:hypothetical protein
MEQYEENTNQLQQDTQKMLEPLVKAAEQLAGVSDFLSREAPDVTT